MTFPIGSTVYLSTYSPPLQVAGSPREDGTIVCQWFDARDTLRMAAFHPDCLRTEAQINEDAERERQRHARAH